MSGKPIKNQDVAFSLIRKELEHVTSEQERIRVLERLVALEPRGDEALRLRARYRSEVATLKKKAASRGGHSDNPYDALPHERVVALVGEANSGKSTLLGLLTDASPAVSPTPFTTFRPEVGSTVYEDVPFQVVEVPALYQGEEDPRKYQFLRNAEVLCITARGASDARSTLSLLEDHLVGVVGEPRPAAEHRNRPRDEAIEKPGFIAAWEPFEHALPVVSIAEEAAVGEALYRLSGLLRVYSHERGVTDPRPLVFAAGPVTVRDFALRLDKRNAQRFRRARIHGAHADFQGQVVGLDHLLHDGDRVTLLP